VGGEIPAENDFIKRLARKYHINYRMEWLGEGVRGYKIGDEIVLNSLNPPERRNWTFCHELGHIVLGHSQEPADVEEREADGFAAETMLPERDFVPDCAGFDLRRLKELYPHASYEAIARRCLQYNSGVLTVFDSGEMVFRGGSEGLVFPAIATAVEKRAAEQCLAERSDISVSADGLDIKGYFIDVGSEVIRVILISRPFAYFE